MKHLWMLRLMTRRLCRATWLLLRAIAWETSELVARKIEEESLRSEPSVYEKSGIVFIGGEDDDGGDIPIRL